MIAINYEFPRGVLCSNMMYDVSQKSPAPLEALNVRLRKNTTTIELNSVISRVKKWNGVPYSIDTRLKANFSAEISLFVREQLVSSSLNFRTTVRFYSAVFVLAQRRKMGRMNYHETWRIIRAWTPPLNEEKPCGDVTMVSDNNNNVSLKAEDENEKNGCRPFPAIFPFPLSLLHPSSPSFYLGKSDSLWVSKLSENKDKFNEDNFNCVLMPR